MEKPTRRQKEFLRALLHIHRQIDGPVHYSALAKHLGVGKVTAYEMLRLLEKRGLVRAEYQRSEISRGPGRSPVVFRPTQAAERILSATDRSPSTLKEWEKAKARILGRLQEYKASGYGPVFEELVTRLQSQRSPVIYLAEMVTAIVLGLDTLKDDFAEHGLRSFLGNLGLPDEGGLSALGGLGVGLFLVERLNQQIRNVFLPQVQKYQRILSEMSSENRKRLAEFTQEVLEIVAS